MSHIMRHLNSCQQIQVMTHMHTGCTPLEVYNPCSNNNYFTEMCSGSEAGSYSRRIDFVHHSILGL